MRETRLLTSASAAFIQIERATPELRWSFQTTSIQSRELVKVLQLKMSIKNEKESDAFYKASKECLKGELEKITADSSSIGELFVSARANVAEMQ